MRRAAIVAVVVALGLIVVGGVLVAGAASDLSKTSLGETRTEVPGQRTVVLERGKYAVFYEVDSDAVSDGVGEETSPDIPVPEGLSITIAPAAGGAGALVLDSYGSEFTVQSGGRSGIAINTVQVPRTGRYRLQAAGAAAPSRPAVLLGEPSRGRVLRLVLGIIVLVLGGLIAIVAIVLAVVAHTRRSGT